jgi:hypothetical protein
MDTETKKRIMHVIYAVWLILVFTTPFNSAINYPTLTIPWCLFLCFYVIIWLAVYLYGIGLEGG